MGEADSTQTPRKTIMTEAEIKLETRLLAIEYMISNVYVLLHRVHGSTPAMVFEAHRRARERLRTDTIPGADPAQSDLWMAEIQENVERMLISIEEMLGLAKNQ
jgi:hypothetical protein